MGRYSGYRKTPAGTNLTVLVVMGGAASRPLLQHVLLGSDATPANLAGEFQLLAATAAPTGGTSVTPTKIDPTAPATSMTVTGGTMTEPTYGGIFLSIPLNQQATFQWWANPGYEPRVAVGTANGIGLRCIAHGGTPNMEGTLLWEE